MKNIKNGIVGVGMVGGTLYQYLPQAIVYDIKKYPENNDKISEADVIFICVPTPYGEKGHDLSMVESAIENIKGDKLIVIKSTVMPGTTENMQKKYPNHKFLFNPEFLTEANAQQNFLKPDRQIVGYTEKSQDVAEQIMEILPDAPYKKIMPATEAELVKYFGNAFLATKVIFANQIYDVAQKLGIDYDRVKEAAAADKRIGLSHLQVLHNGYRGYSGTCLPKDTKTLIQLAESLGLNPKLWKSVDEINTQLTKND